MKWGRHWKSTGSVTQGCITKKFGHQMYVETYISLHIFFIDHIKYYYNSTQLDGSKNCKDIKHTTRLQIQAFLSKHNRFFNWLTT